MGMTTLRERRSNNAPVISRTRGVKTRVLDIDI